MYHVQTRVHQTHTHTTNCTNKRLCHANSYMVLLLMRRLKTRLQGNEKLTCGPPKNQTMFGQAVQYIHICRLCMYVVCVVRSQHTHTNTCAVCACVKYTRCGHTTTVEIYVHFICVNRMCESDFKRIYKCSHDERQRIFVL